MEHRRSIFGPLLLIGAGVIWLLVQSGNIPAANLWALTHIWPFLLIAAGLTIILRSFWQYASLVMDVIIIGGLVLSIVYAPRMNWDNPGMFSMINGNGFYVGPGVPGSGKVVTETREVSGFNSINIDYPAQVIVTQGKSESVKVEAEDNVLPGLKTEVKNGSLNIYYKVAADEKHVNPRKMVKITVVVVDITQVDFDSAGELTMNGIKADSLDVSLSGAGNLKLNDVQASSLSISLSGAGSMMASGSADDLDLDISGFGGFDGRDLHNKTAKVNLSGAGSATLWVDDELDAEVSGVGSVNYYGSPAVSKQVSGVGGVTKSGDK